MNHQPGTAITPSQPNQAPHSECWGFYHRFLDETLEFCWTKPGWGWVGVGLGLASLGLGWAWLGFGVGHESSLTCTQHGTNHRTSEEGLKRHGEAGHGEAGHGTDPWWFPPERGQSFTIRWEDEDSWCRIPGLALERQVRAGVRCSIDGGRAPLPTWSASTIFSHDQMSIDDCFHSY